MMLAEIPSHHFHHVPDLDWDVHSSQKTSRETVSCTWIFTRSGENSTEYIRLLFCTEKIILSNKMTKRAKEQKQERAERRGNLTKIKLKLGCLELREEVVDGG